MKMVFKIELSGGVNYMDPVNRSRRIDIVAGESRFETRPIAIKVLTTYFGLRAHHPDKVKYKKWVSQVASDLQDRF